MISATFSRSANSRQCVAFCLDEGYLPFALFAAHQIIAKTEASDFDICICSIAALQIPETLCHPRLRSVQIDIDHMFDGFYRDERRNDLTYLRLALPEAMGKDYDRILYLDSDIWVSGGDFDALMSVDIAPHATAAVRDTMQWRTPTRMAKEFTTFGLSNKPYFNAGIMLIDTQAFNRQGLLARALEFGRSNGSKMAHADQTLLNCILHGDWAEMSPVWNWQYSWSARVFEAMAAPNIVHFIGARKPWSDPEGILPPAFRRGFQSFTNRHFPQRSDFPAGPPAILHTGFIRRMLFRNILSAGRMRRYVSRFPTELTVYR